MKIDSNLILYPKCNTIVNRKVVFYEQIVKQECITTYTDPHNFIKH